VLLPTSSCLKAVSAAETLVANVLPASLNATLQAIRDDAPNAKIVVVGYPDFYDLSKSSSCIGLSTADRTALNQGANDLDSALATAAAHNGDTFASVQSAFAGHEICDSASWLHSVDIFSLGQSYHPTASGQEDGYLPVFTAAAKS
jgi:hypothetical protein